MQKFLYTYLGHSEIVTENEMRAIQKISSKGDFTPILEVPTPAEFHEVPTKKDPNK